MSVDIFKYILVFQFIVFMEQFSNFLKICLHLISKSLIVCFFFNNPLKLKRFDNHYKTICDGLKTLSLTLQLLKRYVSGPSFKNTPYS